MKSRWKKVSNSYIKNLSITFLIDITLFGTTKFQNIFHLSQSKKKHWNNSSHCLYSNNLSKVTCYYLFLQLFFSTYLKLDFFIAAIKKWIIVKKKGTNWKLKPLINVTDWMKMIVQTKWAQNVWNTITWSCMTYSAIFTFCHQLRACCLILITSWGRLNHRLIYCTTTSEVSRSTMPTILTSAVLARAFTTSTSRVPEPPSTLLCWRRTTT